MMRRCRRSTRSEGPEDSCRCARQHAEGEIQHRGQNSLQPSDNCCTGASLCRLGLLRTAGLQQLPPNRCN
eukprot:1747847-Prymnesium_polylepis.1